MDNKGRFRFITIAAGIFASVFLAGCAFKQPTNVTVYQERGVIQCESSGMTVAESADKLRSVGVNVKTSSCGVINGFAFVSMCGAKTADIIVHDIDRKNLVLANELGYSSVKDLASVDRKKGYSLTDCE